MLNIRSHSDSKGFELKRPNDSIYTFPSPDCMCHTNKSADLKSWSATWTAWLESYKGVSHTCNFLSTSCCWPPFSVVKFFDFFPFPCGERAYTSILVDCSFLLEITLIWLFGGTACGELASFSIWCQRKTERTFFPRHELSHYSSFPGTRTEHCCVSVSWLSCSCCV